MAFDQATLDAIKAGGSGEMLLRPAFSVGGAVPPWQASWQRFDGASFTAFGDTEGDALDNLLLVMTGKADEVAKSIRLKAALSREAETQAALDAAKAEREAIEAEAIAAVSRRQR